MVLMILANIGMHDRHSDGLKDGRMDGQALKEKVGFSPPVACTLEGQVVSHTSVP